LEHFTLQRVRQAVDADDAVLQRHDGAGVACLGRRLEILDAGLDEIADFGWIQLHLRFLLCLFRVVASTLATSRLSKGNVCREQARSYTAQLASAILILSSSPLTEPSITRSPARITAPATSESSVFQLTT